MTNGRALVSAWASYGACLLVSFMAAQPIHAQENLGTRVGGEASCWPLPPTDITPTANPAARVPQAPALQMPSGGATPDNRSPIAPKLRNRDQAAAAVAREYPSSLRNAGVAGKPEVWLFVDTAGVPQHALINRSSGHPALDQAALRVACGMKFDPARNAGDIISLWVSIPIPFQRDP